MLDITEMFGHEMHEFERPLCIVASFPEINKCVNDIQVLENGFKEELEVLRKKYLTQIEDASKRLVESVKSNGLWPYDYCENTDHLMVKNGVVFYARHSS